MKKIIFALAACTSWLLFYCPIQAQTVEDVLPKAGVLSELQSPKTVEDVLPKVGFNGDREDLYQMYEAHCRIKSKQETYIYTEEEDIESEEQYGDIELLAQLVHAEAGNQTLEGKVAVASVVLNRVDSYKFPDTIEEVIFQPGQFSVMRSGGFDKAGWTITQSDYQAAQMAVSKRTDDEILYFSSGDCYNGTFMYKIGDHYFAK